MIAQDFARRPKVAAPVISDIRHHPEYRLLSRVSIQSSLWVPEQKVACVVVLGGRRICVALSLSCVGIHMPLSSEHCIAQPVESNGKACMLVFSQGLLIPDFVASHVSWEFTHPTATLATVRRRQAKMQGAPPLPEAPGLIGLTYALSAKLRAILRHHLQER